jgi:hypothetical protein
MPLTDTYYTVKRALSNASPNDAYFRWDAPSVEVPKSDEEENARRIGERLNNMQQHNLNRHRHCFRATHIKTQGIVNGKMTILSD